MADLFDAVIVGGGIMGTALTCALAKRSLRVALLESHSLASGATGSGFAWVNATYKCEDADYFALNAQAVAHYERLIAEASEERIGVHSGGSLFWTTGDDSAGMARLKLRVQQLQAWNYPALLLTSGELAVLEPHAPRIPEGETNSVVLFAPADKWVETTRLCRYFASQAQEHQAEIYTDCVVTGFTRNVANHVSTVETSRGRLATNLVLIAAGKFTPALVGSLTGNSESAKYVPIRLEPGLLVQTLDLPPHTGCQRVLYPPDAGGLHLRPTPGNGLLIGAEDVDAWLNSADQEAQRLVQNAQNAAFALPETLWHPLLQRAACVLPGLPLNDLRAQSVPRLCIRPVPTDGLPIIGALPGITGAYVAVTHSGVTLGPFLAELLANEIVTQAVSPLLSRYRPARF